jgi:hypothetical protein
VLPTRPELSDDGKTRMVEEVSTRVQQSCRCCRFWRRGPVDTRQPDWGECRRMPPTLPPIEQEKLMHVGIWPHTAADDWCGEWQAGDGPGASADASKPAGRGPT